MKAGKIYIYGRHAVAEALSHAPHVVRKLLVASQMDDKELRALITRSGIEVEKLDERKATSQVEGGAMHQGIIALISLSGLTTPFETFARQFTPDKRTLLVFLSEIQDPHNVGAIIRSAAALGAQAVLMPTHKQAGISGAVIKASAGMAFRMPLVTVDNMQQALSTLKKMGVLVYGFAQNSKNDLSQETFDNPSLFIFGNEASGLNAAAKSLCDKMLSIPIHERAESLNVAASAAIALYAWSTTHK